MNLRLFALTAAATAVVASPRLDTREKKIKWGECKDVPGLVSEEVECATLKVPRDYTDKGDDAKELELTLARVPATEKESKGSILLNFGGPGQPSIVTLASLSPKLLKYEDHPLALHHAIT